MARLEARPFDEGLVVIVGAGGAGQDPHEVAVVAQVLQQAGHPPGQQGGVGDTCLHGLLMRRGKASLVSFLSLCLRIESSKSSANCG